MGVMTEGAVALLFLPIISLLAHETVLSGAKIDLQLLQLRSGLKSHL